MIDDDPTYILAAFKRISQNCNKWPGEPFTQTLDVLIQCCAIVTPAFYDVKWDLLGS